MLPLHLDRPPSCSSLLDQAHNARTTREFDSSTSSGRTGASNTETGSGGAFRIGRLLSAVMKVSCAA